MRRRKATFDDPLDLLLDTVCNLFGVIIFVAILAALLSGPPTEAVQVASGAVIDAETIVVEIENPEAARAIKSISAGQQELENRRLQALQLESILQNLKDDSYQSDKLAVQLSAELESLEIQLRAETEAKQVTLRTPRSREIAEMVPVQIVISAGQAYVVNDWSGISPQHAIPDRCDGWTAWNEEAVDVGRSNYIIHSQCWRAGGQDIERFIWLLPGGGVPIHGAASLHANPRWLREIRWFHPDHHIISLQVAPDSFEEYAAIRGDIAARGFHYDVEVIPAGPLFHDRLMEGMTTAQ